MTNKKPKIGIVLDREPGGGYSEYPYYVLREHYFDAVTKAGGVPIGLDLNSENINTYLSFCDGLLLPGGDYDIPPEFYGETTVHESVVTKTERLHFDIAITKAFLAADKPVLGICAGEQLLAVLYGGTLLQDIPAEVNSSINHYNANREMIAHEVSVVDGTKLHHIVGVSSYGVNSHHHQSVKTVGERCLVSASSLDGVIEAIEIPGKKFCVGVQWHPEFINTDEDIKLFEAFIEAC